MLNLATILESSARRHPGRTALSFGATVRTYTQVDQAASQVAFTLQSLGVRPGDRVALSCPNLPWFPVAYFGILKAGAVVVPLNVLFKAREVAYHLSDSGARLHLCFEGTEALPMGLEALAGFQQARSCERFVTLTASPTDVSPLDGTATLSALMAEHPLTFESVATEADDSAVILYTSGTTGTPKGAELTHANMVLNARESVRLFALSPEDRMLGVLPLFHSFGQTVVQNATFAVGGTVVLHQRFDAATALRALSEDQISVFAGVPTMYWALVKAAATLSDTDGVAGSLRIGVSGGASLPLQVLHDFESTFGVPIYEGYGLSETSPVASFNQRDRPRKPGSIGTPIWGVEMKVVDAAGVECPPGEPGEILIRGHNVMKGYLDRPDANAAALRGGWFHSGDVGRTDEDGYFYVVDRTKDMILRGGYNVYPREVEEVMMEHEAVSLVAVVGRPDEALGEEVCAFVVHAPGTTATAQELVEWCRERMAAYKYPRVVEFRASLPMTATGKILKKELREGCS